MTHTTHSITKQRVPAAPHDGSTACQCQTHVCVPPTALTRGHMFATRCFKTPAPNKGKLCVSPSFWLDAQSWIRVRSVAGVGSQTSTHGRHTLNWALCGPCATVSCPQRPARVLCRVATRVARLSGQTREPPMPSQLLGAGVGSRTTHMVPTHPCGSCTARVSPCAACRDLRECHRGGARVPWHGNTSD